MGPALGPSMRGNVNRINERSFQRSLARLFPQRQLAGALLGIALLLVWMIRGNAFASPLQGRAAPDLASTTWINSAPLTLRELRGKVVLLEFWTYG